MITPIDFIHRLRFADLPSEVVRIARRCLLDLVGCAAAGRGTANSAILHDHVAEHAGPGKVGARLLLDGRRVSVPAAAMAGAATIDSYDAHDGHRLTKGHAGVVVLPSLLAFEDELAPSADGAELLTRLVLGYEVALRAGIALHATAPDYHTSGAWNALGAAAIGARALRLDRGETRHALGTAEYYGPRSQMMRCIDFPTMLKDGATFGAYAGVTAALLALRGFTGAPAITIEGADVGDLWSDLGARWRITEQYFKPWPVCRWAQPAVEAAFTLRERLEGRRIVGVTIRTFGAAARLDVPAPASTEEAQYALQFPVAVALVRGVLDGPAVTTHLADAEVVALAHDTLVEIDPDMDQAFPARRLAAVELALEDGSVLASGPVEAHGDPDAPLSDEELEAKFVAAATPMLGDGSQAVMAEIEKLGPGTSPRAFIERILSESQPVTSATSLRGREQQAST